MTPGQYNGLLAALGNSPGFILPYGAATPPAGWLLCDGSAVSRVTYGALFAVIGTTWGIGDGSTTFNLPDLRGRMPIGRGTGSGLTARALATQYGAETSVVAQANLPSAAVLPVTDPGHAHALNVDTDVFLGAGSQAAQGTNDATPTLAAVPSTTTVATGISVGTGGSDTPLPVLAPCVGVSFVVKT